MGWPLAYLRHKWLLHRVGVSVTLATLLMQQTSECPTVRAKQFQQEMGLAGLTLMVQQVCVCVGGGGKAWVCVLMSVIMVAMSRHAWRLQHGGSAALHGDRGMPL